MVPISVPKCNTVHIEFVYFISYNRVREMPIYVFTQQFPLDCLRDGERGLREQVARGGGTGGMQHIYIVHNLFTLHRFLCRLFISCLIS